MAGTCSIRTTRDIQMTLKKKVLERFPKIIPNRKLFKRLSVQTTYISELNPWYLLQKNFSKWRPSRWRCFLRPEHHKASSWYRGRWKLENLSAFSSTNIVALLSSEKVI